MNPDFKLVVCDDPDYEDLIAELTLGDELFCIISQEQGFDRLEIAIYPTKTGDTWSFKVSELEEVIANARQRLFELRKGT